MPRPTARTRLDAPRKPRWLRVDLEHLRLPGGTELTLTRRVSSRARRLRLHVDTGGAILTIPARASKRDADAFLASHLDWLERHWRALEARNPLQDHRLVPGEPAEIMLRGRPTLLTWQDAGPPAVLAPSDGTLCLRLPLGTSRVAAQARSLLRTFLVKKVTDVALRRFAEIAPQLGLQPRGLSVSPLKSIWGSLSARDVVSLDLALVLAPPAMLDYVIVHELCHLRVRNHSPRFWALVESLFPDWAECRGWLNTHGLGIKSELKRLLS
jgi:predicted metal-dependent hydrolase